MIAAGARSETSNLLLVGTGANNVWLNKWSAQRVSSAPTHSKERSNARFSSRRLARALELSFDAPLWIGDQWPGVASAAFAAGGGGDGGGGGGGGGSAADASRAMEAMAGLAAALTR
jgi:hypothetical protein